jgi:NOL1/NOP2/fmu family ribosome biogenesis protein
MLQIFNSKEKAQFEKKLNTQFGIQKIPGILLRSGTERIFLFQGDLSEKQITELDKNISIERIGTYFAKEEESKIANGGIRLSIEGTQILKDQIKENTFELNAQQTDQWMKGHELDIQTGKNDFLIMSHKGDFLGTGKSSALKISNYIPKNRRLKEKS